MKAFCGILIALTITVIGIYTLAMLVSYSRTGHPAPDDEFEIFWWQTKKRFPSCGKEGYDDVNR